MLVEVLRTNKGFRETTILLRPLSLCASPPRTYLLIVMEPSSKLNVSHKMKQKVSIKPHKNLNNESDTDAGKISLEPVPSLTAPNNKTFLMAFARNLAGWARRDG